eukprot:Skav227336  [mRNA]  locus=scaffold624:36925:38520:- [translate_table: standard]
MRRRFAGNAQQARRMLKRESRSCTVMERWVGPDAALRIAQSKIQLVSAMLETFSRADADENGILEGEELLEFFGTVDQVCKDIPGVDAPRLRLLGCWEQQW